MQFTYLDLVDKTILFEPIMARNWFKHGADECSLFTPDETKPYTIPGYHGMRCIVEVDMAKALSQIHQELKTKGLGLKVYDTYRPQKTVSFFTQWTTWPDTPLAKKYHYPNAPKQDFHALSYLSQTSSHTLGTAVDVTVVPLKPVACVRSADFLGHFDSDSLDMGVGYLCFDQKSWRAYDHLTKEQKENRKILFDIMDKHGFEPLDEEFWHYYYKRDRNRTTYFDFDIRDDYTDIIAA
ncbi:MAG: M15 family metallopeptidase [Pseudomonadota bacterium]